MTDDELGENSIVHIAAGSETTATRLSGTLFYLLKEPTVHERPREEIRSDFKTEGEITIQTVSGLEYLLAVLKRMLTHLSTRPYWFTTQCAKGLAT